MNKLMITIHGMHLIELLTIYYLNYKDIVIIINIHQNHIKY